MEDWTWWQQAGAFVVLLAVAGWASAMHREAKRSADALEQIATQLDMDRMDRNDRGPIYPGQ